MEKRLWKVSDFVPMDKEWGTSKKLIGKIEMPGGRAWIGLFRMNSNGSEIIRVHKTGSDTIVFRIPVFPVSNDSEKQAALDKILEKILKWN